MSGLLAVVRRWWWLLVIGAAVAALMGFVVANRLPETYQAEAKLLVGPLSADKDTLTAAGAQARTYAVLATTAPILDDAAQRVGVTSIRSKVHSVIASDVTRILTITTRDGDPGRAAAIANALAAVLVQRSAGPPEGRLLIVDRATPPAHPVGPSAGLIVPLTALVGLLGAFGIALLVDSLTTVVRSEADVAAFAPVLGSVNGSRAWRRDTPLVVDADPDSSAAASYRVLATKIELSTGESPLRSLLLVDAHGGRSSSRVAANLAIGFAEDGTRVVLLDTDERGGVMTLLAEDSENSSDVVQKARPLRIGKLMFDRYRIRRTHLVVLRPRKTSEALNSEQANETIEHLLAGADLVLLTAAPPDQSSESLIWARAAKSTVLVAERDRTKREQLTPAIESLRVADANVIGAVLS